MSRERREFDNPFPAYDGKTIYHSDDGKLHEPISSKLKLEIQRNLQRLEEGLRTDEYDDRDYSIYTGTTGIVLLYLHLSDTVYKGGPDEAKLFDAADKIISRSLAKLKGRRVSFMCGDAGPLAVGAVVAHKKGDTKRVEKCISQLHDMVDRCCNDKTLPDEILYGRAGFLMSLLYVRKHIGDDVIKQNVIDQVCQAILASGEALSRKEHSKSPLAYRWHEKEYIGAAHGYIGIMYTLLQSQCLECLSVKTGLSAIKGCVDYLLSLTYPSGNFPSSVGSSSDKLVHWCHGAPGGIHLMARAYQVFGDEKYLDAAKKCGDVIWQRGLLQRGYGMCHGVSGNAYGFLCLYNLTKDVQYLYKALKFAEWCYDYGKHGCRIPDTPYSLFEGLAGTIYFEADLLTPTTAKFPAFQFEQY